MGYQKPVKQLQKFLLAAGSDLPKYGADGYLGLETTVAIEQLDAPQYVKTALNEIGVYEIKGAKHHPRVIEYHQTTAGKYSTDEVPWCGSFINWVMVQHDYLTVDYPERAKSWLAFDIPLDVPMMGAIAIKSRKGGGHVTMIVGMNSEGKLWGVGGNQNNEVNLSLYDAAVFESFQVPCDYDASYELIVFDDESQGEVSES